MFMKIYFLVGWVCCALGLAFLIIDITTYVDYVKWLSVNRTYLAFNFAPDLMKHLTLYSIGFSAIGVIFLIVHFKKWYETPQMRQSFHKKNAERQS